MGGLPISSYNVWVPVEAPPRVNFVVRRILFVVLGVVVIGCSSGGSPTTTAATAITAGATTTATEAPTTTEADTTTTAAATGGASVGCVLGDWVLDTESFELSMESAMVASGGEAIVNVTAGGGNLTFSDDGSAAGAYEELTLSIELGTDLPTMGLVLSGDIAGTWALEGDSLTLTPDETSNFEISASIAGQTVPVPMDSSMTGFGSARSTITCDEDELFIEPEVEGANGTLWLRA
ncbi:hypothetical protein BH18ACT5_BH18ACT5_03390 [soil metagenome]